MREKILIFGTGSGAVKTLKAIDESVDVIGFIDNNKHKQGLLFENKRIYAPQEIANIEYDKIVICSVAFSQIKEQLIASGIKECKIASRMYFHEKRFLERYDTEEYKNDAEIQEVIQNVKKDGLKVFNYPFADKYKDMPIKVFWDEDKKLFYVIYHDKKMYMSKKKTSEEQVKEYLRFLYMEQDDDSPHKYLTEKFDIEKMSVVVDAGVAEGNFALDIIDRVKKLILIEADDDWIEALQYTFEPYKEKVQIIKGFLGNVNEGNNITLDNILSGEHIDFIKMDIEGSEPDALRGATTLLKNCKPKLDICVYHNEFDQKEVVQILERFDYNIKLSKGYMVFLTDESFQTKETKTAVRGLVRAW